MILKRQFLFATVIACVSICAENIGAGKYTGKWEGASGASGDFALTLTAAPEGKWNSDVTFSFGGQEVKCQVKSVSVNESKIRVVYGFDLQGTQLESAIEGELAGKKLGGTYKTRVVADNSAVDEGTWQTTAN